MGSHCEVNIYGSIYGIPQEVYNKIKDTLEQAFDNIKYECGSVVIESYGIHRNLDLTFDLIASSITTEEQSHLDMDPCGPEIPYRAYFKKDVWDTWEPKFTWPKNPFDSQSSSENYPALTITRNDAFEGLQEYRTRVLRKTDDSDEVIDKLHNAVMDFSEEDMKAIARNLGEEILCDDVASMLFWEALGEFVQTIIDANERKKGIRDES